MTSLAFPFALKEVTTRNSLIVAAYRDWARKLPPGPLARLAQSMAEQRADLGETLAEIGKKPLSIKAEVELETAPASAPGGSLTAAPFGDSKALLKQMAETEEADQVFLAALANAVIKESSETAQSLSAESEAARKRAVWAKDQLELMAML